MIELMSKIPHVLSSCNTDPISQMVHLYVDLVHHASHAKYCIPIRQHRFNSVEVRVRVDWW